MTREVIGIYRLTRWKEHLGSSVIITALGLSIAAHITQVSLFRALIIFLANFLCFTFSFMLNDIEDAEDDALDVAKRDRNPVSAKILTKRRAFTYTGLVGLFSLLLFATLGLPVLAIGTASLILGVLYSWKRIRLKTWPVVDLVSHALFLGSLQFLAASLVDSHLPPLSLLIWIGFSIFIFSILGDVHNELRDFEVDQKSGHLNTAQLFDLKRYKKYLKYLRLLPAVSILLYFLLTFSILNMLTGMLFVLIVGCFYYLHGYRNGRPFYNSDYTWVLQAGLGLLLFSQTYLF